MLQFDNLTGLKKVKNDLYNCEYLATSKDWLNHLQKQDYKIIGINTLLRDIDYLITNQITFFLWFNDQDQIVFEW